MSERTFDPSKPIAETTMGGYQCHVSFFDGFGQFPLGGWVDRGRGKEVMSWTTGGRALKGQEHPADLVNINIPDPAPVVNWDEPLMLDDGIPVELVGPVDPPLPHGATRVLYNRHINKLFTAMEDGSRDFEEGNKTRVINVPKPKKTVTVGVVVDRSGTCIRAVVVNSDGSVEVPCGGISYKHDSIELAKKHGGWHILREPKEVEMPE